MSKTTTAGGGGGTSPVNTVAPVISGSGIISYPLSCADGTWTGTPVITYTYQWKRNGIDIVGETNSTYILDNADYGNAITCEVTGTNAFGFSSAVSNTITGTAIAPVNTVAPVIAGTNVVGSTLTTTKGTWTVDPSPLYTYQWYRGASPISGATSDNYTLVQADAAQSITCVVTATNVAGTASATSNALTIIDADAQAFFTASGLTGATNLTAINNLVVALKGYGIWTKMKAIYPFVGGTAALHKWNLKDPQDTNAAFRLVFAGGWTHASTGAKPNGVNAYADTFLTPSTSLLQNSTHISYYSRTQSNNTEVEIGSSTGLNATDNKALLEIRTSGVTYYNINGQSTYITYSDADSRAFYIGNRTASNVVNGWRNSTKVATGTTASTGLSTRTFYLGAFGSQAAGQFFSTKECAFSSIGDGLTDTEAASFYTAVQAYNTNLGRNNP